MLTSNFRILLKATKEEHRRLADIVGWTKWYLAKEESAKESGNFPAAGYFRERYEDTLRLKFQTERAIASYDQLMETWLNFIDEEGKKC